MKLYFSIITAVVLGTSQACEIYPGGEQDAGCQALRAQGQVAQPAQPRYQSAQDRCTYIDGYGLNTRFTCVPHSLRTGTGYEGAEVASGGEPSRFYTHSVSTPNGNYTIRGYTNGSSSTTSIYRTK